MKRINAGLLCFILAGISTALIAQDTGKPLKKGEVINASISSNESHRYLLQMEKDQFTLLEIMQKGVDLKVTTYDPAGKMSGGRVRNLLFTRM